MMFRILLLLLFFAACSTAPVKKISQSANSSKNLIGELAQESLVDEGYSDIADDQLSNLDQVPVDSSQEAEVELDDLLFDEGTGDVDTALSGKSLPEEDELEGLDSLEEELALEDDLELEEDLLGGSGESNSNFEENAAVDSLNQSGEVVLEEEAFEELPTTEGSEEIFSEAPQEELSLEDGFSTAEEETFLEEQEDTFSKRRENRVELEAIDYLIENEEEKLLVKSKRPVEYEVRTVPQRNQYIVELKNSYLPARLKRPLIMKDYKGGSIGSVNLYQKEGSSVVRVVVQMKAGTDWPQIFQTQNQLEIFQKQEQVADYQKPVDYLVEKEGPESGEIDEFAVGGAKVSQRKDDRPTKETIRRGVLNLFSYESLTDFLSKNLKFYGHKISIEANQASVIGILKFLSKESGINMVFSDQVDGSGNITLSLKEVPWDQVFIMILKTKRLAYTRVGNILRIAPIETLQQEADDAQRLKEQTANLLPKEARSFLINYAEITTIQTKIQELFGSGGSGGSGTDGTGASDDVSITVDERSLQLIVVATKEKMGKIASLVEFLDRRPRQVLIQGKIIETLTSVSRSIGLNWGFTGISNFNLSSGARAPTSLKINPFTMSATSANSAAGVLSLGFKIGTLGPLGDLEARLGFLENEDHLKVLSSPRILVLNNQSATINQTNSVPFPKATISDGQTTVTTEYTDAQVSLNVTPKVSNDNSILMTVSLNQSVFKATPGSDGAPPRESRSANTQVIVKNGDTVALGGIYTNNNSRASNQVPFLSKIPILGYLFKNNNYIQNKNELILFLSPKIVED